MSESCPNCKSQHVYQDAASEDGGLWICPECGHEYTPGAAESQETAICRDANGQVLHDGDTVVLVKDLKIKGASGALKGGTKVKGIRIIEPEAGHNLACRIDGVGAINLKSEFVKKV